MKKGIYLCITSIIILLLTYMIYIGSTGLALQPRKDVFTFTQGEKLPSDPAYYLKGVTDPSRVHMKLDQVNTNKVGTYKVKVKQSSRWYEFYINIEKEK